MFQEDEPSVHHVVELEHWFECRGASTTAEVLLLVSNCSTSALQPAFEFHYMMYTRLIFLEHLTIDKLVNCRLTGVPNSKLGSYTLYLTSSLHIPPTVAQTNTIQCQVAANFVTIPALKFGSCMLYKA